jgi:hypothetical protein
MNYMQLLDATARIVREEKRGFTPETTPPILKRLGIEADLWLTYATEFGRMFSLAAGNVQSMADARTLVTHRQFHCPRFQRMS